MRASGYAALPSSPGASCTRTSAFVLRFKVIKIWSYMRQWLFNNRLILRVFCCTAPSWYLRGFCWSYKASTLLVWKLVKACGRASSAECFQMLLCSFDYWKWFLHNPANFLFVRLQFQETVRKSIYAECLLPRRERFFAEPNLSKCSNFQGFGTLSSCISSPDFFFFNVCTHVWATFPAHSC